MIFSPPQAELKRSGFRELRPCRTFLPRLAIVGFMALTACAVHAADAVREKDPYAKDPYWYRPGHPTAPANTTGIKIAPGFQVERILTVPREMGSWTALCTDPQGRLITAAQEQAGLFRVTLPPLGEASEAIVEKLTGVAATVGWSQGLLYAFDSLYVTVAGENSSVARGVYRLKDTDGDDQFDQITQLFQLDGSGEHGPHNLVVAPNGRELVLMCGNKTRIPPQVKHVARGVDGGIDHLMPRGFESSQFATQGWAMRFGPDGSDPEVILTGLRNSYDLAFDRAGELFTFDSDAEWDLGTPWYRPTRISHLIKAGEFGWRDDAAVWPEYFEDSVAPVLNIGPGSPSGLVFGYGAAFPEKFQRALFVCDWTFATIHAVFIQPSGASYQAEVQEFVGGNGLPLTDVVIGKEGAMYFTVGGRRLGSAVYRVRYIGDEPVLPVADVPAREPLQIRRRAIEAYYERKDPAVIAEIWAELGSEDRAIRFAARTALESQPIETWKQRALEETRPDISLGALLALARKGSAADQLTVAQACGKLTWSNLSTGQKLRLLRVCEVSLARSENFKARDARGFAMLIAAPFPDADSRVNRELSRLRCAVGDVTVIDPLLDLMAADEGDRSAQGASYFSRNPKYGEAVRGMLAAAPLVERMHHAQMLLWLSDRWTASQRKRYFALLADAVSFSKGGHSYVEFWNRIRETAMQHTPESERASLDKATVAQAFTPVTTAVPPPQGPGRNWTVDTALDVVAAQFSGRDFAHGRSLFSAVGCVACHRLGGEGGTLGPDLNGLGQRFTVPDILESIVDPSRAISDQYKMVRLQTRDGKSYSGRVLSRDAHATRISPNLMRPSQTVAVPKDEIVEEQSLPVSLMPSALIDPLNENELLDLLAYLVSGADATHSVFNRPR